MVTQVGIKAAVGQRTVNWQDLVWPDQLSELYGNIYVSSVNSNLPDGKVVYPDFGVGGLVLFANPEATMTGTAGLAVDHIFQPDVAFMSNGAAPLPRKWVLHADLIYSAEGGNANMSYGGSNDPLKINPGILYQNQSGLSAFQAGLNLLKFNIYIGAWYKSVLSSGLTPTSQMTLLAGYRYNLNDDMSIRFIYSYDMQISGNLSGTGGAHEISLVLEFGNVGLTGGGSGGGRGNVFGTPGGRRGNGQLECPSFF
jgi:type IX secretion system PorP/SprF family membrane protein